MPKAKPLHPPHSLAAMHMRAEAPIAGACRLYADGAEVATAAARADLLAKLRAGEWTGPLEMDITSYVQRPAPNRNFVRFGRGTLRRGAHSFKGQVFLVDHAQREQAARIGTILTSVAERAENGDIAFRKRVEIVKRHAIESALDGTIDRFSIGWYPTGPIDCSACKGPMFGRNSTCPHWPGDQLEGGGVVEAIYTAWEGVEVSAVNVPAVLGTGVDEIRAALAADRETFGSNRDASPSPGRETMDIEALRRALNMPATATAEEILAAAEALTGRAAAAELAALNAQIESAYADGRLAITRDATGNRIAGALETQIRALPLASATALLAALPRSHPNTPPSPTAPGLAPAPGQGGAPPPGNTPPDRGPVDMFAANPKLPRVMAIMGVSREEVLAYGPQHRAEMPEGIPPPNLSRLFRTRFIGDLGAHPGERLTGDD